MKLVFSAIGRICENPELQKRNGKGHDPVYFVRFSVAVNSGSEENNTDRTDFISCVAFNNTAKILSRYVKKGNNIAIDGRIQQNNYKNDDGDMVYSYNFIADQIHLVESASTNKTSKGKTSKGKTSKGKTSKGKTSKVRVDYDDYDDDDDDEIDDDDDDIYPF